MNRRFSPETDLLQAVDLGFCVNGRRLLQSVSLTLPRGKMSVLIGPNGAGKSTLMRLLSGYLSPEQGQIHFDGQAMGDFSAAELAKRRAVMRQHSRLNFPFRVEEVIRMGAYHRRPSEIEAYWDAVIEATECRALQPLAYSTLSGGEQQRVQLARALLQLWDTRLDDKLLLLDEPTSAFDLHHQQHCLRLLKQLCEEKGLTVCIILHDLNLAALYADQLILLAEQQIRAAGAPYVVLTQPILTRWYQAELEIVPHTQNGLPQIQLKL